MKITKVMLESMIKQELKKTLKEEDTEMKGERYIMAVMLDQHSSHIEDVEIQVWDQNGMDMSEKSGEPADIETCISTISLSELYKFYIKNGGKLHKNEDYNPNFKYMNDYDDG